jgi:hypothetical protein
VEDHKPVVMPNTITKVTDKAMLEKYHEEYTRELLPQQLGVGVKFAAKLLAMGIKLTLHIRPDHILVSIDLKNAYNSIWRGAILERHRTHDTAQDSSAVSEGEAGPQVSHLGRRCNPMERQ